MPVFFVRAEIGHATILKIEAPDKETAITLAEKVTLDDFENAGPLKRADVSCDVAEPDSFGKLMFYKTGDGPYDTPEDVAAFDQSLVTDDGVSFEYAADDPAGRAVE